VGKYSRVGQGTEDNMAHALNMLNPKATNTNSEYVILIDFPLQQWLDEDASLLRYTFIVCIVDV